MTPTPCPTCNATYGGGTPDPVIYDLWAKVHEHEEES